MVQFAFQKNYYGACFSCAFAGSLSAAVRTTDVARVCTKSGCLEYAPSAHTNYSSGRPDGHAPVPVPVSISPARVSITHTEQLLILRHSCAHLDAGFGRGRPTLGQRDSWCGRASTSQRIVVRKSVDYFTARVTDSVCVLRACCLRVPYV